MKPNELKLSHQNLLDILEYFPDKGIFIWKITRSSRACIGQKAGSKHKAEGRYFIKINKTRYARSRLAWFYVYGIWPENEIDHRNRIPSDDRIKNLREATHQENMWNTITIKRKNNHLPKGIYIKRKKFTVRLTHENQLKHLGNFDNLDDAVKCRDEFEAEHRKFLST